MGFRSSRRREAMWSSLPINEHVKLHPHVEQSLLKTTLKLAEGLLYNIIRKIHKLCKKGRKVIIYPYPWKETQRKNELAQADTQSKLFEPQIGCLVLGCYAGKTSYLGCWRTAETNRKAVDSKKKHSCMCAS